MSQNFPPDLQKVIDFHGHFCPGLAIGYRAAKTALEKLAVERAADEELVAIVETDACGIDALQALLGCTMGKGNLIYKDYGKQVYTIISRRQNKAVRIAMRANVFAASPEQEKLRAAVFSGQASAAEQAEFYRYQQDRIRQILTAGAEELFTIEFVTTPAPQPARIFKSVICAACGEPVMEPRARIKDGQIVCLACAENYTRGW